MSEEEKKTNDEEKTIPRPEGYTIVKYAEGWTTFVVLFGGMLISPFILYLKLLFYLSTISSSIFSSFALVSKTSR